MNSFTKEELEEINRCLKYMIKGGITPYSCITLDAKKKIQSMIDNYCEHPESEANHNYEVEKCKECGALFV